MRTRRDRLPRLASAPTGRSFYSFPHPGPTFERSRRDKPRGGQRAATKPPRPPPAWSTGAPTPSAPEALKLLSEKSAARIGDAPFDTDVAILRGRPVEMLTLEADRGAPKGGLYMYLQHIGGRAAYHAMDGGAPWCSRPTSPHSAPSVTWVRCRTLPASAPREILRLAGEIVNKCPTTSRGTTLTLARCSASAPRPST